MSRGRFEGTLELAHGEKIQVHRATGNQEIFVRGQEKSATCTFTLVLPESENCLWQRRSLSAGDLVVRSADVEVHHWAGRQAVNLSLSVGERTLRDAADTLGVELGAFRWQALRPEPVVFQQLEKLLRSFLASVPGSAERSHLEEACLRTVVEALCPASKKREPSLLSSIRADLVQRGEDQMRRQLDGFLCESDLCRELGVSGRTLRLAFQEHYGLGPIEYYRVLRLNAARRTIKNLRTDSESIASIAQTFGFHHSGKFSLYFRRLFGELPSEIGRYTASKKG